jgi:uncharacterized membrane protein YfcA
MLLEILVFLSSFIGWIVQGFLGIGSGIIIPAILLFFMDIKTIIVSLTISNIIGILYIIYKNRLKKFSLKRIYAITFSSVVGVFIGSYLLGITDVVKIKLIFGVIVAITGFYDFLIQTGNIIRFKIKSSNFNALLVGFVGGIFSGLVGGAGSIYALYFNQTFFSKRVYKFYISVVFLIILITRSVYYFLDPNTKGYYDAKFIILTILGLVPGVIIGNYLTKKVKPKTFKKIVSISITLIGLYIVISNL